MIKNIKFNRPLISGIEIKRCSQTEQSYKEHLHKELSIGHIEEGSTVVCFNNEDYVFTKGEGIIIPPFLSHICRPNDIKHWQFVMIYIDTSYYKGQIDNLVPRKLTNFELNIFQDFLRLISKKHVSFEFEVENALIELLITCVFTNGKMNEGRPYETIDKIYNYIKDNYLEEITLQRLEKIFNLNKFTIIRGFKSVYNTTPSSFLLQLKVAHSKDLLAKGMSILDVCSEVGFYDQAHFTREFKKAHGKTPSKYQKDIVGG